MEVLEAEHAIQEAVNGSRPDPFGEGCRALDVDKEKESLFVPRAVIATEHDVAQGA